MYHPQMSHYTIYTGEQRFSPAPFSPPPSPPKSEMWSTTKGDKPSSYNLTGTKSQVHQLSTSNLNYGAYPSEMLTNYHRSNDFANNSPHVAQHYPNYNTSLYNKVTTAQIDEASFKNSNISNDIEKPQTETKKLSRMSINFVLDNDETYEDISSATSTNADYDEVEGKEIDRRVYAGRKRRCRKNPYPMRAPSKDAPGINLKVDISPVMKDPAAILRSNDTSAASSPTDTVCSQPFSSQSTVSLIESNDETTTDNNKQDEPEKLAKRQQRPKARRSRAAKPERKRKGNSLARVMTDRGLLESIFNSEITSNDIKSVRIPPPPPMQHHELMALIKGLNIDHGVLDNFNVDITWKGQPLNIAHLPHYKELHETEAKVVSILRLTPVQYLTGKHTLISAARRYVQRSLPFKKSDAQKLLRIDVNKASKLWEFFRHIEWI